MGTVRIPLRSRKYPGLFAIIDEADYPLVSGYRWVPAIRNKTTYAIADKPSSNGKRQSVLMHRLLTDVPADRDVDHINENGLDNRRENLRVATKGQNAANAGLKASNTSGYRGVSFNKNAGKWQAYLKHDRTRIHLGLWLTAEDAARAFDAKAIEIWGEFARLNLQPTPSTIGRANNVASP